MQKIHQKLKTKCQFYNNWRQTKHHNKIHWGMFLIFSFFILTLLLNPLELNLKKDNQFKQTQAANPIDSLEPGHWYEVPNSKLRSVVPNPAPPGDPATVITAWSGGAFDTKRDRLIVWGGGHSNYAGNEIYVFDLNTLAWKRVNEPSNPIGADLPYAPDGNPSAVHTYSYLQYVPNIDRFCSFGGQGFYPGISGAPYTNCFNFETLKWEQRADTTSSGIGAFSAIDPVTGHVWQRGNVGNTNLSDFDALNNTWTVRNQGEDHAYLYRLTADIDPVRRKFVAAGRLEHLPIGSGDIYSWDIGTAGIITRQTLTTTGAIEILNVNNPGFVYDPVSKKFVAWSGGADVYTLDMDTLVWTKHTPAPTNMVTPTASAEHGTFGRFRYSPKKNVFVVVNDIDQNVYIYKLNPGGGIPPSPDTTPPAVSLTAPTSGATVSGASVTVSANASDNVGVSGVQFKLDGVNLGAEDTTSPYSITWNTTTSTNGSHTLTAMARDAAGNQTTSAAIALTVSNTVDTQAPSVPTNLSATAVSSSQINLSWSISTDNTGVAGYKIYRCTGSPCTPTTQIATSNTNSYSNTGLAASTAYTYAVSAYDAVGNESNKSLIASITTLAANGQTAIPSFTLTSPTSGTLPFTTGLAFKKGDVPEVPVLDLPNSQVIVKRRWNDGSVKHAIASGLVDLTAGTPKTIKVLSGASTSSGTDLTAIDIKAANPSASVQLGSFGTVDLSTLLANPFRTWISGLEMVEAHYRSAVGSDPTLVVWFHVRLYKGGQIWIRAIVENGYLDIAAETKNYTAMVNIHGVNSYTGNITHYPHTRWTAEGWIGGDPQVTPRLDTQYLIDAKLVPNYWKLNPSAAKLNSLYQSYIPFERGGWTERMGSAGFQDQIGLLPLWDALYVSSGGDERAFKSVIANAKALNSYAIAWNDSITKLPTIPSNRPRWTAYGEGAGGGGIQGAGTLLWELAHHGSGGYLAYLISGDYYFLETMQNQSSLCYLMNTSSNGLGTMRLFTSQTRSVAWRNRTVGQFAAIGPLDAITTDYQALLSSNVSHWKNEADRPGQNLIGYLYDYIIGTGGYGVGAVAPWQEHFWIQTYGHLSDLEPIANMADLNRVRDNLYKGIVGILGSSGEDNYCYTEASRYTLTVAPESNSDPTTWYDSWGKVYEATHESPNTSCGTTLGGGSGGAPNVASTGFWGNLLPAIAYAVDHGAPGASASWSRLTNADNWSTFENSGFDDIPIWGIVPRTQLPEEEDTTPPTMPTNLTATPISSSQINLSWSASTDNVGVTGYKIYRNSQLVKSLNSLTYSDTGLTANTAYTHSVSAIDGSGNESEESTEVSAVTLYFSSSDLNQDQKVNSLDFEILKLDWNKTTKPKSDINQDGMVNTQDLGIMMSEWGG